MRRAGLFVVIAALVMPALACAAQQKESSKAEGKLDTQAEKLSYSLGMQIAKSLQKVDIDLDTDALVRGLTDALEGDDTLMTSEEAQAVRQEYIQQRQAEMKKKRQQKAKKQKKEAEEFLAKNKKKEGVKTTDSGLQYKVIEEGEGATPSDADRVQADMKITTIGGREIFNSQDAKQQRTLPVAGLLPGLTEGLKLMKEGAHYKLFVPPELGIKKQGKAAGPGLIVDVTLNEVMEGAAKKQKSSAGKGQDN